MTRWQPLHNPITIYMKNVCGFSLFVLAVNLGFPVNCSADDLAIGYFGSTNYGDWKLTGNHIRNLINYLS
jgi:hypothetical protein